MHTQTDPLYISALFLSPFQTMMANMEIKICHQSSLYGDFPLQTRL
uniref:Alternative protein PER2 n=1 Tax=Homo sapiens TaxID=9606 RepID=L8E8R3_HUMAN|nr:alternative protein PER2 [Homo sapiens]